MGISGLWIYQMRPMIRSDGGEGVTSGKEFLRDKELKNGLNSK